MCKHKTHKIGFVEREKIVIIGVSLIRVLNIIRVLDSN